MNKLRQLYQGLGNLDEKFADRAQRDIGFPDKFPLRSLLGAQPIKELGYDGAENLGQHLMGAGITAGLAATNIGYRYGLPAAGVTLAGKGLFDLSYQVGAHFGSKADQPEQDTLTLD